MEKSVLNKLLFLDIETIPEKSGVSNPLSYKDLLFAKKLKVDPTDIDLLNKTYIENAGLYPEFGQIICISIGMLTDSGFKTKSLYDLDEQKLLQKFSDSIENWILKKPDFMLSGHNLTDFDIPYLCKRLIINRLKIPNILKLYDKKPWERSVIDTYEVFKFGSYSSNHKISLDLLCEVMGVESSKQGVVSSSSVRDHFYNSTNRIQALKEISEYCERDIVAVYKCLEEMIENL